MIIESLYKKGYVMNAVDVFNSINSNDSTVGVAGDWHMNFVWAEMALDKFHDAGVRIVLHQGDFGIWGGSQGARYLTRVNDVLVKNDMYLFVTLGNHENYDMVESFPKVDGMPGCVMPIAGRNDVTDALDRIVVFSRGFAWEWNNKKFMSVGGAASIDFSSRVLGESFWVQELLTENDVENCRAVGKVDVVFSHDAPYGVEIMGSHRSGSLPIHVQEYTDRNRKFLKKIMDVAQPSVNFHGHYHIDRDEVDVQRIDGEYAFYETRTICLDKEFEKSNMAVLNTVDLSVSRIA